MPRDTNFQLEEEAPIDSMVAVVNNTDGALESRWAQSLRILTTKKTMLIMRAEGCAN